MIWRDERPISPGPPRQRALLTILAARANRVVSRAELIAALWEQPPATAGAGIHTYVAGLRRLLEPSRARHDHATVLISPGAGYLLRLGPGGLDAATFEHQLSEARRLRAAGDMRGAATKLNRGLALWRGDALAGVPGPFAEAERQRLAELRSSAVEERADALLAMGLHAEALAELTQQVAEHPLRERLRGLLMIALYRCGRPAEALRVYADARRMLADELGLDPGAELTHTYEQVLMRDPALDAVTETPGSTSPPKPAATDLARADVYAARTRPEVPAQVPLEAAGFTGREAELAELDSMLTRGKVPIAVITGTAGVGKTALAIRFAHRVAMHFPDGQLYVNLRGFDPSRSALPPRDALGAFFYALGVPPARVPESQDAQAGLFRSLLNGSYTLVVLDNARTAEQVRPLLPASPGCMVVITSRSRLTGLVATEGARLLPLDVLTDVQARELLRGRLGESAVVAEPQHASELIRLCAGLPLALSVALARAAARPSLPLSSLAAELRDEHGRLDMLDAGDTTTDVRGVFSWSYRQLSGTAARMFRLLGLHPGPDLTVGAAASLADLRRSDAAAALAELTSTSLLAEHAPGRFSFHDLLRAYATEQAAQAETPGDLGAATSRLLDYYARTASTAVARMYPARGGPGLPPPPPGAQQEPIISYQQALSWLEAERPVLLAAASRAFETGDYLWCWHLYWTVAPYLNRRGYPHEYLDTRQMALTAAEWIGDPAILGRSLYDLAHARGLRGECTEAYPLLDRAMTLFTDLADRSGQARVHYVRMLLLDQQGRYEEALGHAREALRLRDALGDKAGAGYSENSVAWLYVQLGRYQEALDHCGRAVALLSETGSRSGAADSLDTKGRALNALGENRDAIEAYAEAVALYTEIGYARGQRTTLTALGDAQLAAGELAGARATWERALAIPTDDPAGDTSEVAERIRALNVRPDSPSSVTIPPARLPG
jgi:DNA-binding SARP family transcriptional activator/predicted negative regulator of RcsB-dependent stress response